ncbi:peptidase domain-containing ABC transporter [Vulcanococcus limneticus]|uniref:peptidase domain-containing ABC transporter n=1 Tax=Vulcanococcus limneticus TaxID=2170428 RepID=UPI00398C1C5C
MTPILLNKPFPGDLLAAEPGWDRRRYRLGQVVLLPDQLPDGVSWIQRGQLRSLGPDPTRQGLRTLDRHGPGDLVGWVSLLLARPCEHVRVSSEEAELLWLPADRFGALLLEQPALAAWCASQLPAAELDQLLAALAEQTPAWLPLREAWPGPLQEAQLMCSGPGVAPTILPSDGSDLVWFVSSGPLMGQAWTPELAAVDCSVHAQAGGWCRLVGLRPPAGGIEPDPLADGEHPAGSGVTAASECQPPQEGAYSLSPEPMAERIEGLGQALRLAVASGPRGVPMAITEAIARYFGTPFNRDVVRDQVEAVLQRQQQLNLVNMGQLIGTLGLRVLLAEVPVDRLHRVPTPAVLLQAGQIALLDGVEPDGRARLLEPELGAVLVPIQDLAGTEGSLELLLMERTPATSEARFSWGWFLPYLKPHRRELVEVLVASLVVNLLALATPLGLQVLVDQVARFQNLNALISISALLLVAGLVAALVRTLRSLIFTGVANRIDQDTKATILDQLVRLPQSFFDSRPVGQITFYFTQLDRLREFLIGQSLTTIVDFSFSILYVFILLAINPLLTLVTLSTLPLILMLALVSNPLVERGIERSIGQAIRTYSYLNEAITGIQTIKSQNAELKTRWEFQNRYSRFIGEDFKLRVTNEMIGNLATLVNDLNGLLVVGFGIWLVMQNQITLGGFFAFRIISGYITGPMVRLVQTWQQFKQSSAQLKLVGDIVDRQTEQTEKEASNIPMPPLVGEVQFCDVTFRFGEQAPRVLHGINLEVPTGAFVGMVGGSGSGKSTLLKLLPRFYRPEQGKVLIDGFDINKVELYSLRRQIGVVPQDSLLFDGTIRENLLLVKPDASTEDLIRATRIACAHDFIMEMPQGYNSSVGERGAGLSGGQRQRLALARAVLQNPRMLILDEATSALDARTERQVCLNLFEAFRGRTVFFITHRLSTVRPADMIVLMDRGAVMEVGSHDSLMAQQGWYYALFQSQNQEGLS